MKLDFTKNTRKNVVASSVSSVVSLIFPFLNRTLFLWLLGPEYLGLNGLFASILSVLSLAELGFGNAVVCSIYKPLADDDNDLVCAYIKFYRTAYRWVGSTIFVVGLCLLPFLRQLVHGNLPPGMNLHVLYLMHLTNTAASYFLFAYRGVIIGAHQCTYVLTNIRTVLSLLQYVCVFLILTLTRNYYFYVLTTIFFTLANNLLLVLESKRLFPEITPRGELPVEKRRKVISDVKAIFMHKVGSVISYSIDNVVLSAYLGLVAVAAYGNYYYISAKVAGIPWIIYGAMAHGFGNKIHTESRERNFQLFMKVNRVVSIAIVWCAAMMMALYQPFIAIWTHHKPELLQHGLTAALFVMYLCITQSRGVLQSYKAAAGLWLDDRWKPVVNGAVKLPLCVASVCWLPTEYKLDGVILSSIIGFSFVGIPWEARVVFTKLFDRAQEKAYWRSQAYFALIALLLCAATWWSVSLVRMDRIPGLLVKAALAGLVSSAVLFAMFRREILEMFGKMLNRTKA